jgi:hypothetical protein
LLTVSLSLSIIIRIAAMADSPVPRQQMTVIGKIDDPGLKTILQSQRFPPQRETAHVQVAEQR